MILLVYLIIRDKKRQNTRNSRILSTLKVKKATLAFFI